MDIEEILYNLRVVLSHSDEDLYSSVDELESFIQSQQQEIEQLKSEGVVKVTKEASKVLWRSGSRRGLNGTMTERNVLVMYDCMPVVIIDSLATAPKEID